MARRSSCSFRDATMSAPSNSSSETLHAREVAIQTETNPTQRDGEWALPAAAVALQGQLAYRASGGCVHHNTRHHLARCVLDMPRRRAYRLTLTLNCVDRNNRIHKRSSSPQLPDMAAKRRLDVRTLIRTGLIGAVLLHLTASAVFAQATIAGVVGFVRRRAGRDRRGREPIVDRKSANGADRRHWTIPHRHASTRSVRPDVLAHRFHHGEADNVSVSGSGVIPINAELRLGSLQETITVSGVSPIVDTQTTRRETVINSETISACRLLGTMVVCSMPLRVSSCSLASTPTR